MHIILLFGIFTLKVAGQDDIYHGLVQMEEHFRRSPTENCKFPQFSVLHVKKRAAQFDKNSLPKNIEGWKEKANLYVFLKEKYLVSIKKNCHAEFSILSKDEQMVKIYDMVKSIDGKVDLMLFTQNAPCCLKAPKGKEKQNIEDKKKNNDRYNGCDPGSCTKVIIEFVTKFEAKYPDIKEKNVQVHISWRQPYISQMEIKDVLKANDPMYYRMYFESLFDLVHAKRVRIWLLQNPWKISWFQKAIADYVIKKRDYKEELKLQQFYILINRVTSYCLRYGTEYLKEKPVQTYYPFSDTKCWAERMDQIIASETNNQSKKEDELIKAIILEYIKQPMVTKNIQDGKWILGPPLNPDQGRNAKDVDIAIYSAENKAKWYTKAFSKKK